MRGRNGQAGNSSSSKCSNRDTATCSEGEDDKYEERKRRARRTLRYLVVGGWIVLVVIYLVVVSASNLPPTHSQQQDPIAKTGKSTTIAAERVERLRGTLADILRTYGKDPTKPSTERVILLKTHKTGSSTLGGILFRWSARHGKRACCAKPHTHNEHVLNNMRKRRETFDVFLNHVAMWHKSPVGRMPQILDSLRDIVPQARIVTSVREPISHFVSFYNYFIRKTHRDVSDGSVETFASSPGEFDSPLAADFGIRSASALRELLEGELDRATWIIQDRFVESLVLMRRVFNWDMADVLYAEMTYSSRKRGSFRRYDGKVVEPTQETESLPTDVRAKIEEATSLDRELYDTARERVLSDTPRQHDIEATEFLRECDALRRANELLSELCDAGDATRSPLWFLWGDGESTAGPVPASCEWYKWSDVEYESHVERAWPGDPWEGPSLSS
eukprot:g2591.t1